MPFKPDIWAAKKAALEQYGEAVTRWLMKSQPLKYLPDYNRAGMFMFAYPTDYNSDTPVLVKPPYSVGEVVYIKEAHWYPPEHNQNRRLVSYRQMHSSMRRT